MRNINSTSSRNKSQCVPELSKHICINSIPFTGINHSISSSETYTD